MPTLDVLSPFTGEVIETIEQHTSADLQQMLGVADQLQRNRKKWLGQLDRQRILHKAAHQLREDYEAFAQLIAKEGAKPLKDARVEALRAADGIDMATEVHH